jgi:hypothetical protein
MARAAIFAFHTIVCLYRQDTHYTISTTTSLKAKFTKTLQETRAGFCALSIPFRMLFNAFVFAFRISSTGPARASSHHRSLSGTSRHSLLRKAPNAFMFPLGGHRSDLTCFQCGGGFACDHLGGTAPGLGREANPFVANTSEGGIVTRPSLKHVWEMCTQ